MSPDDEGVSRRTGKEEVYNQGGHWSPLLQWTSDHGWTQVRLSFPLVWVSTGNSVTRVSDRYAGCRDRGTSEYGPSRTGHEGRRSVLTWTPCPDCRVDPRPGLGCPSVSRPPDRYLSSPSTSRNPQVRTSDPKPRVWSWTYGSRYGEGRTLSWTDEPDSYTPVSTVHSDGSPPRVRVEHGVEVVMDFFTPRVGWTETVTLPDQTCLPFGQTPHPQTHPCTPLLDGRPGTGP